MDMLWCEERLHKIFSKDSLPLTTAQASGDAGVSIRCCRLCSGDANLRSIFDKCNWRGVEEQFDQLLCDYFGVQVSPHNSLICERCVFDLRNVQRFRALVQTAFKRPPNELATFQSHLNIGETFLKRIAKRKSTELLKKSTRTTVLSGNKKRKLHERKPITNTNVQVRRMNIACTLCNHKYPMIVPFEGWKKFICSRCKKNGEPRNSNYRKSSKCLSPNIRDRPNIQVKTDLKARSRVCSLPKNPSQIRKQDSLLKPKYQCSQCNRKYSYAQHLNHHVESVHNNLEKDCVCAVCGEDMSTKCMLEKHMRVHSGQPIYQCDICLRVFKGKRTFQTHYLSHGK